MTITRLTLPHVTLVALSSVELEAHISALEYSSQHIKFGAIKYFSHKQPKHHFTDYEFIQIPQMHDVSEWGKFLVFDLHTYIETDFILLVHADGFIVSPQSWEDRFLDYDYLGAPWPLPKDNFSYRDTFGNIVRVGNSVSLRSKRLLQLPSEIGLTWDSFDGGFPHEDGYLCVQHRHRLSEHGIRYAPLDVAVHFGREINLPEHKGIEPFCFHKWAGPNRKYPCFNPATMRRKKWWRVRRKLKETIGL